MGSTTVSKKQIIWLSVLVLGITAGAALNHFFAFGLFIIGLLVSLVITVFSLLLSAITKSKTGMHIGPFLTVFLLAAIFSSIVSTNIAEQIETSRSEKIIHALRIYKLENGHLPKDISSLSLDHDIRIKFQQTQQYLPNSSLQEFEIHGYSDGWHTKTFYSTDGEWKWKD